MKFSLFHVDIWTYSDFSSKISAIALKEEIAIHAAENGAVKVIDWELASRSLSGDE